MNHLAENLQGCDWRRVPYIDQINSKIGHISTPVLYIIIADFFSDTASSNTGHDIFKKAKFFLQVTRIIIDWRAGFNRTSD
ncbi:hypothetical protein GP2143_05225 [marine gamma proteobacterium HTCC2143]|jgi:hypothetical protein|uniref:Uncharacterized protein n=1 Tax=marine gamma proteobacterium HTCC2143 TaxID=247633 RepID=A0YB95_9GAMM|nr:hypothetical protein GP2143_05225 [marine gamma proteobacterium HTCC2143]